MGKISVLAEADIAEGAIVKQGAAVGGGALATSAADLMFWVAEDQADSGQSLAVVCHGNVKGLVGGAVEIWGPLKIGANGKFVAGVVGTDIIVGQAMQASTADGELITVRLIYRAVS